MKNVLKSSDNDMLYAGIATDTEYQTVSTSVAAASRRRAEEAEEAAKVPNLSGEWTLNEGWTYPDPVGKLEREAKLFLEQDGRLLRGHAQTNLLFGRGQAMVDQEISGFVRDNKVEMVATSYQFLHPAEEEGDADWSLDT